MKKAFTLLELIIVIVVIGILAAVIFPRLGNDTLVRDSKSVLEAIRYTQHLAMVDDKFDNSKKFWQKERWCIDLNTSSYSVYTKKIDNSGNVLDVVYANDPLKKIEMKEIKIDSTISPQTTLCFDEMGRPYANDGTYANLLKNSKTLTISYDGETKTITIRQETGYVSF